MKERESGKGRYAAGESSTRLCGQKKTAAETLRGGPFLKRFLPADIAGGDDLIAVLRAGAVGGVSHQNGPVFDPGYAGEGI